jgi:thiamine transport system permease protein
LSARRGALIVALPLLFLGYFFVYPLAAVLVRGLADGGIGSLANVLTDETLRGVAWFTLWQAVVSTVATVVVAMPAAYVFARYEFRGKRLLRAAFTVPFVMPTVVVGSAFLALLGPQGPLGIDLRRTFWAVLIAHVFYNFAVVVRTVGALWERIDPRLEEAARVLGAGRWAAFRETTLPLLAPALASAAGLVFLFTFTSFGVVLILGDLSYRTLEVEIWRQTTAFLDLEVAAALAVFQLVGVTAILIGYARYQQRRARELRLLPVAATSRRPRTVREHLGVWAVMSTSAVMLGAPLAVLIERSLRTAGGYGLHHYQTVFASGRASAIPPIEAIGNSVRFAAAASLLAVIVGLSAATIVARGRGRTSQVFDAVLMLPLGTSAVTLGLGFLIALDRPVDLRGTPWLVVIAHALVAVPLVVRVAVPTLRSVQQRLREAAAVLGADRRRVWREIDLPIVASAMATGAGLAAAVSLGEFGATAFIARPDAPTLPIAIFRLLGQPGRSSFGEAMALATILMLVVTGAILLIDRFRVGAQEF